MRLGKKELEVIKLALTTYRWDAKLSKGDAAYVSKLLEKVSKQGEIKAAPLLAAGAPGPQAGPIHDALVAAAGGKVVSMASAGPAWWARASRTFKGVGATPEKATTLGTWLANQAWMTGTVGWDTILHKWEDWYARAANEFGPGEGGSSGESQAAGRRKASW